MDNLNNIPNVGNWGDAASRLNDNFNKIKQAVTTVENTSKNNKGYFTSLSALNTAFPSPKDGQTAYVYNEASSTKYYIYNAVDGAWVATSIEAPSVGVDLAEYTKTGGSTKTTKEVEDDLTQLAAEVSQIELSLDGYVINKAIHNQTGVWVDLSNYVFLTYLFPISSNPTVEVYSAEGSIIAKAVRFFDVNKDYLGTSYTIDAKYLMCGAVTVSGITTKEDAHGIKFVINNVEYILGNNPFIL